ncbi:MAG: TIGR04282 family arsenosugar biosynthesis glycosyltransferase [Nitrospirota bacterium]|nr:TIGR04282 family arsenosugar biosynthesis glycosyltransferase [Nitrospirota bacterium]MDH5775824.1 TIGR04282 family arsenosugar biosynthesis glycosyltransferase [Nitrospirota bacterium]
MSGNPAKARRIGSSPRGQGHNRGVRPPASTALIVFAKAPVVGQVKTRLCPPLTPDEAASLHGSLVLDLLERCQSLQGCDRILAGAPTPDHPFFGAMKTRFKIPIWEQVGEDLGVRMSHAFQSALGSPYQSAIIIGTDIPGITAPLMTTACKSLHDHDLVLGPTVDGGYYLIGLRSPVPELFAGIPWSTETVCSLTQEKAQALGLSVKMLPMLRDLDTIEDLQVFIQESKYLKSQTFSVRTKNVLQELEKRLSTRQ